MVSCLNLNPNISKKRTVSKKFKELKKVTFLKQWCKSYTSMLLKKENPEDRDNYRPITLTNSLLKNFTQIICNRLVD